MKKEYIILILLIVALSGYLVFKKEDRSHYTLPEPPAFKAEEADRLTVKKKDTTLEFRKTEDGWQVSDNNYPADKTEVNRMLEAAGHLKISALVSEKGDLVRYELDPGHAVAVTAFKGDTALISFKIGKTAPSYNHTFVQLADDTRVFHAAESFRSHFDKDTDDFRDKQVLDFPEQGITKITIETGGVTKVLTARETEADKEGEKATEKPSFVFEDGTAPNKETVSNLLDTLSGLKCDQYPAAPEKAALESETPDLKITLENRTVMVLNLFDRTEGDQEKTLGTSSMNGYAFELQSWTAKDIRSYADELAGLKPKEKEDKGSE